jgi:hypothetical protein
MMPITAAVFLLPALPASGQQMYVPRYDVYTGYSFLSSPHIDLFENGFAAQVGFRPRKWLSFGFDYTLARGEATITSEKLLDSLQQQLGAQLRQLAAAGRVPRDYQLSVPIYSETHTFAVGPQLAYRRLTRATLFLRPVFAGLIREIANPEPGDPIARSVVAQLAPSGQKSDTTWFLGFGGGFDIIFTKTVSLRTQADLVYDHLFKDMLKDGRFTTRFSIGPAFNFGRNIVE